MRKDEHESEVAQSFAPFSDPTDCSPPGFSIMAFSRPEYWSGLPFPSPGDLPDPGIEPRSPTLLADALPSEPPEEPQEYWSGLPCPPPGHLPDPEIEPRSPALPVVALPSEAPGKPRQYVPVRRFAFQKQTFTHQYWSFLTMRKCCSASGGPALRAP